MWHLSDTCSNTSCVIRVMIFINWPMAFNIIFEWLAILVQHPFESNNYKKLQTPHLDR